MPLTHWQQYEGTASGTSKESNNGCKIEWQTNELIDIDSDEIQVKVEPQPVIEKVQTTTKIKDKGMKQVCNLFGLNHNLPLEVLKHEMKIKTAVFHQDLHKDSPKANTCTSIYVTQMPPWFKFFHVKALIQLKSYFDVYSESYYIDMLKQKQNRATGECLIRFMENKDCLQVYRDLQGIEHDDGPILVSLDLDNEIANKNCCSKFEEQLRKYNEARTRHKQQYKEQETTEDTTTNEQTDITNVAIKKEIEEVNESLVKQEIIDFSEDIDLPVKTEFIEHLDDLETMTTEIKQEPTYDNEWTTTQEPSNEINNHNFEENIEIIQDNSQETAQETTQIDHETSHDLSLHDSGAPQSEYYYYYKKCTIIHIKNIPTKITYNSIFIIKDILTSKTGKETKFQYAKITNDDKITTDILLEFESHVEAEAACNLLHETSILGNKIDVTMGLGYRFKKQLSAKDLQYFERKRKLIYDWDHNNELPPKKARTQDTVASSIPVDYGHGYLPPEEFCHETFGLRPEFMKALKIKPPFTRRIIVSHLHPEVNEGKLLEIFSLAGDVRKVDLSVEVNSVRQAKIEYDHPLEAVQAISMFHTQLLYNLEMKVRMDLSQKDRPLPLGLASVGQGLGLYGRPLRGVRFQAEMRKINEMFVEIGALERDATKPFWKKLKDVYIPFKFTYKKCKVKDIGLNKFSNRDTSGSRSNNPDTQSFESFSTNNAQTQDYLVFHGITPSESNCQNLQSIMAALQKKSADNQTINIPNRPNPVNTSMNIVSTSLNIQNRTPNPNISAIGVPSGKSTVEANQNNPLDEAINRVMQFMTPNTLTPTLVPPNLVPSFQGNQGPHIPAISTPIPQPSARPQPEQRNFKSKCKRGKGKEEKEKELRRSKDREEDYRRSKEKERDYSCGRGRDEKEYGRSRGRDETDYRRSRDERDYRHSRDSIEREYRHKRASEERYSRDSGEEDPGPSKKSDMLVFNNLPPSVSSDSLIKRMSEIGELKVCEMTEAGRAFLRFVKLQDAERCIRLYHRSKVDGQIIEVGFL